MQHHQVAVVTGSTKGLGRSVCEKLLNADWAVVGMARGASPLNHPQYTHMRVDLSQQEPTETIFSSQIVPILKRAKKVLMINNAAVLGPIAPLADLDWETMSRIYTLNVVAPSWLAAQVLHVTAPSTSIQLVAISSGAARGAYSGWSMYCSTKAALRMVSQVVAEERPMYPDKDISVLVYEPGVLDTDMQAQIRGADISKFPLKNKFVQLHKDGKLAACDKSAEYLLGLLSGLSGFKEARYEP
ncbi:MAG: SDR family NAD(P)-dependent oxidoreductase [Oligoflexales bacterium]